MNTHVEIRRPAFSSFLKAEVAEFASSTIGIVQSKDPESLLIAPVFNPLEALSAEIELLGIRFGIDPERVKEERLKQKLMLTISSLKLQVRLISKTTNNEAIYVIGSFVDSYLRHLNAVKVNNKVITQQVEGFVNSVATNAPLARALADHDLIEYVTMIEVALEDFRDAVSNRRVSLANRPKVNTQQIISKVASAIDILFKGIEVAQVMNAELDYKPLVDELNELVDGFRLSIRLRASYNRRKSEEEKANEPEGNGAGDEGTPSENGDANGEENGQTTSSRSYSGYAPYGLAIAPMSNGDDPWGESTDVEVDEDVEYADEPAGEPVDGVEADEA